MYWYNPNMEDGEVVYNNIYSSECIQYVRPDRCTGIILTWKMEK